jgi:hypothetical protein
VIVQVLAKLVSSYTGKGVESYKSAELSHLLTAADRQALVVLQTWHGWPPGTDVTDAIQRRRRLLIDDPALRAIMRAAATGARSVTRLEAVQALTTAAEKAVGPGTADSDPPGQPFPAWAVAVLAMNALRRATDDRHSA